MNGDTRDFSLANLAPPGYFGASPFVARLTKTDVEDPPLTRGISVEHLVAALWKLAEEGRRGPGDEGGAYEGVPGRRVHAPNGAKGGGSGSKRDGEEDGVEQEVLGRDGTGEASSAKGGGSSGSGSSGVG